MGICQSLENKKDNQELKLKEADDTIAKFSLNGKDIIAKIVRVYDGDTFWACFYLGDNIVKFNCRCLGYDSPEMKPKNKTDDEKAKEKAAAIKAKDHFIELCKTDNDLVLLKCHDFDKYGRLLVEVFGKDKKESVNNKMIKDGHGYAYDGGTKKDFSQV